MIRGTLIVTGGGRGIGRATALLAAKAGFAVCVNYQRDADAAAEVVTAITADGGRAIALQADVAEREAVRGLFDRPKLNWVP